MDTDTKKMLGKILGEIFRMQSHQKGLHSGADRGEIYGLINGFEEVIDCRLNSIGWISKDKQNAMASILEEYEHDNGKLAEFHGYYTIESKLSAKGIDRPEAILILTLFNLQGRFHQTISKMNSGNSPVECKEFEPMDWEK